MQIRKVDGNKCFQRHCGGGGEQGNGCLGKGGSGIRTALNLLVWP